MVRKLELITLLISAVVLLGGSVDSFDLRKWPNWTKPRIIGGEKADIKDFQYQVSIRKRGQPYGYGHVCGGSVIGDQHILTAAHCIARPSMPNLYFVVADLQSLSKGTKYLVEKIMIHDKYKSSDPFQFDVALIRLAKPLILGPGINIKPVKLIPVGTEMAPSSNAIVAGWGRTVLGNTNPELDFSEDLMKLQLKIVGRDECDRCLGNTHKITPRVICAGAMSSTKKDASVGDSGGPLVGLSNGYQLGIVSFGDEAATSLCPGVYTNLANKDVREFIDRAMSS